MIVIIFAFCLILIGLTYTIKTPDTQGFLLNNRNTGLIEGASSIAITWVWAPALFISAKVAYDWGFVGLTYFLVPNILTLILFGYFADRIRKLHPLGTSIAEYFELRYSKRLCVLYKTELLIMSCAATAVQLVAGGQVLSKLTSLFYTEAVLLIFIVPLIYSIRGGLKLSIFTDKIQYILILVILAFIIPLIFEAPKTYYGISGIYTSFTSLEGLQVLKSFGIPVSLGLLAGAFGSQEYWQRGYALKGPHIKSTFMLAGFLFGIIPLTMGFIGFSAAGSGILTSNSFLINTQFLAPYPYILIMFIIVILCGLMSTVDSAVAAIPTIFKHAGNKYFLILICLGTLSIAFIPNIQVIHLFIVYGMVRAAVFLPTIISLQFHTTKFSESSIFYSIIIALVLGVPLMAYAQLTNSSNLSLYTALFVMFLPGASMLLLRSKS